MALDYARLTLDCANTKVVFNGNYLTVHWALTPSSAFTGTFPLQLYTRDIGGLYDDWETLGSLKIE